MALSYYTDEHIVKTIKKNDSENCNDVLKFIYKSFYPVIEKLVVTNMGNEAEAQDIFQDAVIAFYEQVKREDFMLTCSLKTYLYSISRNLWLKRLAKTRRTAGNVNDIENFIEVGDSNEGSIENEKILLELIGKLDEGCRRILTYFYYDKLRMKEIMLKMNLESEQSAKNKKYKCMKHLMELVKTNKTKAMILRENY